MKSIRSRLVWLITGLLLLSCNINTNREHGAQVSFSVPSRTIAPTGTDHNLAMSFEFSGMGPSGETFHSGNRYDGDYITPALTPGNWTITVSGYNSIGQLISQDISTITLVDGSVYNHVVVLERVSGSGNLNVTVNWLSANEYDRVSWALTDSIGNTSYLEMNITSLQATYSENLLTGDYTLVLFYYSGGVSQGSIVEAVQIYDGYTSTGWFDI